MSDDRARPAATPRPALRQPTLVSYALGMLIGCCLCASLITSLI